MREQAYEVSSIIAVEGTEEEVLERAASVSYLADFSVVPALVDAAKKQRLKPLPADKFENLPGLGAKARILGMEVKVGSPRLLVEENIAMPVSLADKLTELVREKRMVMVVLSGRSLSGVIVFSEVVKEAPSAQTASWREFLPHTPVGWSLLGAAGLCVIIILLVLSYS